MAVHEGFSRLVRVMTDGQNPNTPEMFKEHTVQIATPVTLLLECHCYHIVVFGFAETVERPSGFLTMTQKGGGSFSEAWRHGCPLCIFYEPMICLLLDTWVRCLAFMVCNLRCDKIVFSVLLCARLFINHVVYSNSSRVLNSFYLFEEYF